MGQNLGGQNSGGQRDRAFRQREQCRGRRVDTLRAFLRAAHGGCLVWRASGRRLRWQIPFIILVGGMYYGGVPLLDELRVRHMDRDAMQVTSGLITKVWDVRIRIRDNRPLSPDKHRTRITEGFDVGDEGFTWRANECRTKVTLCSLAELKPYLREGQRVEVTWFADPFQFGRRRIVRLQLAQD